MNFLRELVSQKKTRFKDDNYNLDLTYITPKIIAMAFPAEGFESLYRNRIEDVQSFITKNHKKKYLIINLSNRKYNYLYFDNKVYDVKWPNHYPCPFLRYLETVIFCVEFLLNDKENIIAVHCLAGKGRTGSLINSILLCSNKFTEVKKANEYYLHKRSVKVDRNSQITYLKYFKDFYDNKIKNMFFYPKRLKSLSFLTKDKKFFLNENEYIVEFLDFENNTILYESEISVDFLNTPDQDDFFIWQKFVEKWNTESCTDILCNLYKKGSISKQKLFRVNFNTFFIRKRLSLKVENIDRCSKILPDDFEIRLKFEKIENEKLKAYWENKFMKLGERMDDNKEKMKDKKSSHYYF